MEYIFSNSLLRLLVMIAVIGILYLIRSIMAKIIIKRAKKLKTRYIARQLNNYIILILTILIIIAFWFPWVQSIITALSLAIAAIIIVSKELLLNFIAHGVIITRGLFEAGDRIQIGDKAGDVMETGPLFFTLSEIGNWASNDEPSGRVTKVPNSIVLTQPLSNYSRGLDLIWNEFSIQLAGSGNWRRAKEIAQTILNEHSYMLTPKDLKEIQAESEEVMFIKREPSVKINYSEGKLLLTMRYLCKFHKRNISQQIIFEELLTEFDKEESIKLFSV